MTECRDSQTTVDWLNLEKALNILNLESNEHSVSEYPPALDSDSGTDLEHQRRSNVVLAVIDHHKADYLGVILRGGWDVNEILITYKLSRQLYRQNTALAEATRHRWTKGVKMLLDAGAKNVLYEVENPLTCALREHPRVSADLIELLLQHGVDPNYSGSSCKATPLVEAVKNCRHGGNIRIVELLLKHGADPNGISENSYYDVDKVIEHPLKEAHLFQDDDALLDSLFRLLVNSGADVTFEHSDVDPLLFDMISSPVPSRLDLFFLHGGNINKQYDDYGTALECTIDYDVMGTRWGTAFRWLIRHGADMSHIRISMFEEHFIPPQRPCRRLYNDVALLLLQAGMRVSEGAVAQLGNLETSLAAGLEENQRDNQITDTTRGIWNQLELAEEGQPQRMRCNLRKTTYPEYLPQQMDDLHQFSDDSLHVYPEVSITNPKDDREEWQHVLGQIRRVLEFFSQTQSLQWYCRRCVRENLVSLQPSVIKTLPIPSKLKRYILYHEM